MQNRTCSFLIGRNQPGSNRFYDVQFHWGSGGISVWHKFLYSRAGAGSVVWVGDDPMAEPQAAARTVRLLRSSITTVKCSAQETLQLGFSNGNLSSGFRYYLCRSIRKS
jgi:hypothetical protein